MHVIVVFDESTRFDYNVNITSRVYIYIGTIYNAILYSGETAKNARACDLARRANMYKRKPRDGILLYDTWRTLAECV